MFNKTVVFVLLAAMSLQHGRTLQQDYANNQGFYNQLANPTLPFCFLGNSPICAQLTDNTGALIVPATFATFANECVALLLGYVKTSDGFCPTAAVSNTPTDPALENSPANGYDPANPGACLEIYNPICGENGVTYQNKCYADLKSVKRISSGPCGATNFVIPTITIKCKCDNDFSPVCGSDNVTYQNQCVTLCANVRITSQSACLRPCGCTSVNKPVCSTENETFQNDCILRCKGKTLLYQGECPSDNLQNCAHCAGYTQLVCGKNGVTYDNKCYLECAKVELYQAGACPSNKECKCDDYYLPVCGLDKKTYRNECLLKCTNVKKAHNGACMDDSPKMSCSSCPEDDSPVCGSDGRTYQNACKVKCEQGVEILYKGECDPILPKNCQCPGVDRPVCGVDRKTYKNPCAIGCVGIQTASEGSCFRPKAHAFKREHSHRDRHSQKSAKHHHQQASEDDNDGLDPKDPIVIFLSITNPPALEVLMKYYNALFPEHKPISDEYAKYQSRFIKCIKKAATNKK